VNSPFKYRATEALDHGRIRQTLDVDGHPGLRVVRTFAVNEFGDLDETGAEYHLANGTVFEKADDAIAAWEAMGDELELLDVLGNAMLRQAYGLVTPLWERRTAEQKWPWITKANSFKRLAESLGLSIERRPQ
jgi:hypothetical protein